MACSETDFMYPMTMEVYYPMINQGAYGNLKKSWVLDKVVACFVNPAGRKYKQDVQVDANITIDNSLVGRIRCDITQSSLGDLNSLTNIIVTNIKGADGSNVYNESSGPRSGKATLFEVATFNPIVGAFGTVDYYKIVLRRSDNQAVDL